MRVDFERLQWENYPSTNTPLNADNLNRLEEGVAGLYSDVSEIQEELGEVGEYVTDWLDEHVDPVGSAVVVDDTLTIEGAAADAKKTGDEISSVKDGLNYLGIVGSYHFSKSSGTGGEVTKLYPTYSHTYKIVYDNPSNITNLDFYEFYSGGTNTRVKRIASPTTGGTYEYTPTNNTVTYLRIYVAYASGVTCSVDVLIEDITDDIADGVIKTKWQDTFGVDADPKYYTIVNATASSGIEMTKLYPESGKTYRICAFGLKNSQLRLFEFYTGGTSKTLAKLDTNQSYHYIPSSDVSYLRVYLAILDNSTQMSGDSVILDYDSVMSVPIKETISEDIATDFMLSKEFSAVRKFTVIGDSLASGYYKESSSGAQHARNIPYSWVQIMARNYGQTAQNASHSGATCATWWEDSAGDCKAMVTADSRSQIYIMALGTNDYKDVPDADITAEQIGSSADINESDYTQNADSFWGNYCKILQYVHDVAPSAKIICCTIPAPRPDTEWKQTAIRNICAYSLFTDYVVLCDLEENYAEMSNSVAMTSEMWQGHFTAVGYANSAEFLMYAFSKTIQAKLSMFINLPLIPYDMPLSDDFINDLFAVYSGDLVDIVSRNTNNIIVNGKYLALDGDVYFSAVLRYTNTVATGRNDIFTNLPSPVDTKVIFPEHGKNGESDTYLSYTTAWRTNGAHAIGDVYKVYGKYTVA